MFLRCPTSKAGACFKLTRVVSPCTVRSLLYITSPLSSKSTSFFNENTKNPVATSSGDNNGQKFQMVPATIFRKKVKELAAGGVCWVRLKAGEEQEEMEHPRIWKRRRN